MASDQGQPDCRVRQLFLICGYAALLIGCSNGDNGVTVSGEVTFRGKPLSNASITFYPANGRPVGAAISDGHYSAQLQPGQYQVAISLGVNLPEGWKEGDPIPPREITLPPKYSDVRETPLTATVTEDQSDPIDFALQ